MVLVPPNLYIHTYIQWAISAYISIYNTLTRPHTMKT